MLKRRAICVSTGAIAGALLAGCSGVAPPKAIVADASLRERTAGAAVVEFVLDTQNSSDIELPIRGLTYTLSVGGRQVFQGRREAMATIPRGGSQTIVIPAVVPMGGDGVEPGLHRYTLRGHMHYSLPTQLADVLFDAKISRPSVAFSDEGEIDLR